MSLLQAAVELSSDITFAAIRRYRIEERGSTRPFVWQPTRAELCRLKWDRADFALRRITVTRTWNRFGLHETTKSGKKRTVPMNDQVMAVVSRLWKAQRSEFVFCEEDGAPIDIAHMDRYFKRAQKRAGVQKIRFHDMRHTFASHFMMRGGNIYDLQKILRHSTLDMTQRCAHRSPSHLDEAIKIVSFGAGKEGDSSEIVPNAVLTAASI